jgi:hypothetical protein
MVEVRRLVVVALALTAVLSIRVGLAATVHGTAGPDRLTGTPGPDKIFGRGGADRIDALGGPDFVDPGAGPDVVNAGPGADLVSVEEDRARDRVNCGAGRDVVTAEPIDVVGRTCEVVSVQLSRDTTTERGVQHETQVEPTSASFGRTVVAAYQVGRAADGGAAAMGFATSLDAGVTWRSGTLPGLTGETARTADPSVAYDAVHRTWLVASLVADFGLGSSLVISRSADGLDWSRPVVAAGPGAGDYDKEWITCDGWAASRFRGRCYLSYLNLATQRLETRYSTDGGRLWSAPAGTASNSAAAIVNGAQPVARPDGSLLVVYSASDGVLDSPRNSILAVRSTDGGLSFGSVTRVAALSTEDVRGMRAPPLPSATVDRFGTVYVAWQDCRFRPECASDDVVIATSRDSRTWADPRRVPAVPPNEDAPDVFLPAVGTDPASARGRVRLAVVYHTLPQPMGCVLDECPGVNVWVQRSDDGGRTWRRPQRLTARGMLLAWIADGGTGAMLGDYVAVSWSAGRPVPVFALASPPVRGGYRQAIFATSRLR